VCSAGFYFKATQTIYNLAIAHGYVQKDPLGGLALQGTNISTGAPKITMQTTATSQMVVPWAKRRTTIELPMTGERSFQQ
jgi:hypothetical protein